MNLERFSLGVGDRFGRQGAAQLKAFQKAQERGLDLVPVWNKSNREHVIVGTRPQDTRNAADQAVETAGWKGPYHVDADHIGLKTVEGFLDCSDFFTIDVADALGRGDSSAEAAFVNTMSRFLGVLRIPGLAPVTVTETLLKTYAQRYALAVREAGKVYRRVAQAKGNDFIAEVSVDEVTAPQTPLELFFLLGALANEGVAVQTIAPKFTGEFHKGVDYVGDPAAFAREFEEDLLVVAHAVRTFDLPSNLKLSVHSGSDKFALYPAIGAAVKRQNAGLHLKTAGTTWLEEVAGLAAAGGEGLAVARIIYEQAYERIDELCAPYKAVISIDAARLPSPAIVKNWNAKELAAAIRHEPTAAYNPDVRQLLHVGYKVAAELGERYFDALESANDVVGAGVTANLWERHIRPLYSL